MLLELKNFKCVFFKVNCYIENIINHVFVLSASILKNNAKFSNNTELRMNKVKKSDEGNYCFKVNHFFK